MRGSLSKAFRAPLIAAALFMLANPCAGAQTSDDFYKGKTLHLLIGTPPGGDFDVHGRLVGRHIAKWIPGNPAIVVENMAGAGGLTMANYLYNVAAKDGTYVGVMNENFPALQAAGGRGVQFDSRQFHWLGSISAETHTMVVMRETGAKTMDDIRRNEVLAGASARGSMTYAFPAMMNGLLGAKFKIVTGYAGGTEINLAMDRGEVGARVNSWTSWKLNKPDWVRDGRIVVVAQGGRRSPDLPNVPSVEELAANDFDRQVVQLLMLSASLGHPFAAPPGTPADRVALLRAAMAKTVADPDFRAEAKTSHIDLEPMPGDKMQILIAGVLSTPQAVSAKAKEFLE